MWHKGVVCVVQPPPFPKSPPAADSPLLPFLFFNLPSAPQNPSSSSPSFITTTSIYQGLLSSFNPIILKLNHKENYVSQRRHHALRDRLLIRHSGSRPCLRIREVPSTLLLLPIHGSSFRFSLPIATSAATTLIPFDRSSCQPRTRCNPSCPPFIVGSNAFSSPSVFPRERQNTTHNTPPPSLSSPTVTPSSSSSWLPLHFFLRIHSSNAVNFPKLTGMVALFAVIFRLRGLLPLVCKYLPPPHCPPYSLSILPYFFYPGFRLVDVADSFQCPLGLLLLNTRAVVMLMTRTLKCMGVASVVMTS